MGGRGDQFHRLRPRGVHVLTELATNQDRAWFEPRKLDGARRIAAGRGTGAGTQTRGRPMTAPDRPDS